MKDQTITIYDIAKALNISTSTVSRALNNHPKINKRTKEMVKQTAARLGYSPNFLAQQLRTKKSHTIGVIVPEIVHNFFSFVIDGIEDIAYKAGYRVLICKSDEKYEREVINIQALISSKVDGILASLANETKNHDHLKAILNQNVPLVMYDRVSGEVDCIKVVIDNYESAMHAVDFLVKKGYKRIAHIGGPDHLHISQERLQGYLAGLKKNNLSFKSEYLYQDTMGKAYGAKATRQLLHLSPAPDAILVVSNPVMKGVLSAISEMNPAIFEKIGLVGYGSDPETYPINIPIATIAQPAIEMGRAAAILLLKKIEATDPASVPSETVTLPTQLISSMPAAIQTSF
jgi:DNA-binding LacI/PurR family transcriptional regulator